MAIEKKRQNRKLLTLASLEEIHFTEGFASVKAAFERVAEQRSNWMIVKPGNGVPSRRTDLAENSGIVYDDYSPPALWQPPYAVLLGTLAPKPRSDYITHAGEEIAVPIDGKVRFHFFWT